MHRLKLFFVIIIFFGGLTKTKAQQNKFYIKGFVVGYDTVTAIPLVFVNNITTQTKYITNKYGAFGITVNETDTIEFSVIGYKTYTLFCKNYVQQGDVPIVVKLKRNYIKYVV